VEEKFAVANAVWEAASGFVKPHWLLLSLEQPEVEEEAAVNWMNA
jgi:hypothetical protein